MRNALLIAFVCLALGPPDPMLELMRLSGTAADRDAFVYAYELNFSDAQLRQLVAFLRSDVGKRYLVLQKQLGYTWADYSEAEKTRAGMRQIGFCLEVYRDANGRYPDARSVEDLRPLLEGICRRFVWEWDGWRNRYTYFTSRDKLSYRLISGGPDRRVVWWDRNLRIEVPPRKPSDDIIHENGSFVLGSTMSDPLLDELMVTGHVSEQAAGIYGGDFTEAELRQLISFFESDLGERYFEARRQSGYQ